MLSATGVCIMWCCRSAAPSDWGDKLFSYPARAFSPGSDKDELVLNVAKERLRALNALRSGPL